MSVDSFSDCEPANEGRCEPGTTGLGKGIDESPSELSES